MIEFPDIIQTDIIKQDWDTFWQPIDIPVGDIAKPVLVISCPFEETGGEATQLHKMLQACTLTVEQYHIVQLQVGQLTAWHQLHEKFTPKVILLVGILPQQLGIAALLGINSPNHFNDGIWIPTLSISELEKQPEMKKQLWNSALKPVFVDKSFGNLV